MLDEDTEERQDTGLPLDAAWVQVDRLDLASGEISTHRETSIGGLVARANLTRTGVLTYATGAGGVRRELRHPDEVFDAASLESLAHATLTVLHPSRVTTDNWKSVSVGHVGAKPKRAGKFVAEDIHIEDGRTVADAKAGKLAELSCGYTCHLDPTPGVYEGEPYDAIQRRIRYNHVAIGPTGWGRAGSDVRMHLDGGAGVSGVDGIDSYIPGMTDAEKAALEKAERIAKDAAEAEATARKDAADAKTEVDRANAAAKLVTAENVTLKAENDLLKLQAKRDDSAASELRTEALVAETIAVRADARTIFATKDDPTGAKWKADGKSIVDVRREVLAKLEPELKLDGLPEAALVAVYDIAVKHDAKVRGANATLARALTSQEGQHADGDMAAEVDDAREAMVKGRRDAWKKGTKFDKSKGA